MAEQRVTRLDLSVDPDVLYREDDAAQFLGFTPRALQDWRRRGAGPPFVHVSSRAIRYRRRDLVAWADARIRSSTSDARDPRRAP